MSDNAKGRTGGWAWVWIVIIPAVTWSALLIVLALLGVWPFGPTRLFGFPNVAQGGISTPTLTPFPFISVRPSIPTPTNTLSTEQATRVLKGHTGSVTGVAFSPDSKTLASVGGDDDGRVKVWRVADGSLIYSIDAHSGGAGDVAFSPDGKVIASAGKDGFVRLWNAADGKLIRELGGSVADLTRLAFSPDGQTIAAGSWGRSWMNRVDTVHLWRVADGETLLKLNGNPRVATSVTFSPDGEYLAAGGDDYQDNPGVYIWHLPDGALVRTLDGTMASWAIAFAPQGRTLAVEAGSISFVSVPDGAVTRTIDYAGGAQALRFSPDGQTFVTGSWDNTVRLWSVADGKELHIWRDHETFVESVAFSPDGKLVASGSLDKTVRIREVSSAQEK